MEDQIIALYCLCDDFIKFKRFTDWPNVRMTTSEVMFLYIVAMRFFYGNVDRARKFLKEYRYITNCITSSGISKKIHKIPTEYWHELLTFIQSWGKSNGLPSEYIVDTFPVSVCRNIRIQRCRIYRGEEFRGYNKSKREYFYGVKASVVTTAAGCPIEILLCPGCEHDIVPFRFMSLNLPKGSQLFADSAYTDYDYEDKLLENKSVRLIAERKSNTTRPMELSDYVALKYTRGAIETAFSVISSMLPRKIHAVTPNGFELKVLGFIIAFATTFIST